MKICPNCGGWTAYSYSYDDLGDYGGLHSKVDLYVCLSCDFRGCQCSVCYLKKQEAKKQ